MERSIPKGKITPDARADIQLSSVDEYELEARNHLTPDLVNYIYRGSESEKTLKRNVESFSKFILRRRVLRGVFDIQMNCSYFDGKIKSETPFFPGPVNSGPLYREALFDILRLCEKLNVPIFVSNIAIEASALDVARLPSLVARDASLIWQIYLLKDNTDLCLKQVKLAKYWGYKAVALTVDAELNVKLGNHVPDETASLSFFNVTSKEVETICKQTTLPVIIKGIMDHEDAELAIESGADGIVVSNHGGRILDHGQSSIEALQPIVRYLKSKKATRNAEIFLDGGIRRGTDILKALAMGAKGCLLGRAILWGLAVGRADGVVSVMQILKSELIRSAMLCGVSRLPDLDPSILLPA